MRNKEHVRSHIYPTTDLPFGLIQTTLFSRKSEKTARISYLYSTATYCYLDGISTSSVVTAAA